MELRMDDAKEVERMDVLNGYEEIAAALGITVPQAKHRAAIGAIPIFRQGRRVMARRSSIAKAMAAQEAAAAAGARDA
jgi:hypothetical protein